MQVVGYGDAEAVLHREELQIRPHSVQTIDVQSGETCRRQTASAVWLWIHGVDATAQAFVVDDL